MKRLHQHPDIGRSAAFTLIEMIGVLAIMSILASVLVPNVLRSMDRAAVDAERKTLDAIGEQVRTFVREKYSMPSSAAPAFLPDRSVDASRLSWCKDVAEVSDIPLRDLAINRREMPRVYLQDPDVTKNRVLILSSMMSDGSYALPTPGEINTAAEFQTLWDTAENSLPTVNWIRRGRWLALNEGGNHFLIERIDLRPIYRTDLATFTFRLNNRDTVTVAYDYVPAIGTGGSGTVAAGGYAEIQMQPRARLNLYRASTRSTATLDYTYIVGTSARVLTFDFKSGVWTPQ